MTYWIVTDGTSDCGHRHPSYLDALRCAERELAANDELAAMYEPHELVEERVGDISWTDLRVYDVEGDDIGSLGQIVERAPELLATARTAEGRIAEWGQHFIAAPGEEPDWDTPAGGVDWTGFVAALERACADAN